MRVSFVVPTRNQARFLRRCLDSCLAQGIPDSEIVVVDGLSTDGTQEILRAYGDRVRWTSERDGGQAEAVNKGVAAARGEIIAWLNSDDAYADDRALAAVLGAFDASPDVDVVVGDAMTVDEAGRPIRPYRNRPFEEARQVLLEPIGPSQPATFFRRRLFLEAGGLRPELHYALDYELWLRLFPRARALRYLPRTLALTTFHAEAKSIRAMGRQIREVARVKREHAPAFALSTGERLRLWRGVAGLYAYWALVRLGLRRAA
jgi:glycosyltransferase involved in cell wall biosynthesis